MNMREFAGPSTSARRPSVAIVVARRRGIGSSVRAAGGRDRPAVVLLIFAPRFAFVKGVVAHFGQSGRSVPILSSQALQAIERSPTLTHHVETAPANQGRIIP